ncbi:hypothetical protein VNO78_01955 [Psophocarpus tetragonolobus]|uniref:Uncharacterized protein n=1 Tax=Psophocarpus tetragonolobus TaxID=3891 RepID=A0AAN9XUI6_PSOTE
MLDVRASTSCHHRTSCVAITLVRVAIAFCSRQGRVTVALLFASSSPFRSSRGRPSARFEIALAHIEVELHFCIFASRSRLKLASAFLTIFASHFSVSHVSASHGLSLLFWMLKNW